MPRWSDNINFAKVISILAITFGIALGSCGVTAALAIGAGRFNQNFGAVFMVLGYAELAVMILSAVGLVVVTVLWIIASTFGAFQSKPDTIRLFEEDETKKNDDSH